MLRSVLILAFVAIAQGGESPKTPASPPPTIKRLRQGRLLLPMLNTRLFPAPGPCGGTAGGGGLVVAASRRAHGRPRPCVDIFARRVSILALLASMSRTCFWGNFPALPGHSKRVLDRPCSRALGSKPPPWTGTTPKEPGCTPPHGRRPPALADARSLSMGGPACVRGAGGGETSSVGPLQCQGTRLERNLPSLTADRALTSRRPHPCRFAGIVNGPVCKTVKVAVTNSYCLGTSMEAGFCVLNVDSAVDNPTSMDTVTVGPDTVTTMGDQACLAKLDAAKCATNDNKKSFVRPTPLPPRHSPLPTLHISQPPLHYHKHF